MTRASRRLKRRGRSTTNAPTRPRDPDAEAMLAFAAGDARAFEELYARHRGGLFRFIARSVNDPGLAEELFQDVWTRVIDARQRYEPTARFQTWLYRVATNRIIDHHRARRPDYSLDAEAPEDWLTDSSPGPGSGPDQDAQARRLMMAIAGLPLEQRTALLLQAERGFSLAQIAETCGVGRETIKSRLRYATNKLREALGDSI